MSLNSLKINIRSGGLKFNRFLHLVLLLMTTFCKKPIVRIKEISPFKLRFATNDMFV